MPDTRTVKKIFKWNPLNKRSQGRPKYRWEDSVKQDIYQMRVKNWITCVQDRGKRKDVVDKAITFNHEGSSVPEEGEEMCTVLPPPGVNPTAVNKHILKTWCMKNIQFIVNILMLLPCLWVAAEQGAPVFSSAFYSRFQTSPLSPALCRYASNGIQERSQLDPVRSNPPQHHMYFLQAAHNPVLL